MQHLWEENIKIKHARLFTKVCGSQFTAICAIQLPKKHIGNHFVLDIAANLLGHYGNYPAPSVFFNLCIVSRSPAELMCPL